VGVKILLQALAETKSIERVKWVQYFEWS